jgi:hypothetical protein
MVLGSRFHGAESEQGVCRHSSPWRQALAGRPEPGHGEEVTGWERISARGRREPLSSVNDRPRSGRYSRQALKAPTRHCGQTVARQSPDCPCAAPLPIGARPSASVSTREVVATWPWPDFISSRESRESAFPGRKNFPLLEHHCPEIKCAVHEGLRDVAHDFQPDGPLAQSLRR